jgi:hypothetical protein
MSSEVIFESHIQNKKYKVVTENEMWSLAPQERKCRAVCVKATTVKGSASVRPVEPISYKTKRVTVNTCSTYIKK